MRPVEILGAVSLDFERALTRCETRAGECKSKTDEDVIMQRESMYLRALLNQPKVEKSKIKEIMLRLMYLEMLGHDASFGYIHAVKACVEPEVAIKRAGYLATTSFLSEGHDLMILIVNTVQRDLKSDDYLVVCAALTAIMQLVNEETVPAVLPQVTTLLMHPVSHVRKKAVMALMRFHQKSPQSIAHLHSKFREMLCDKDPSVMSAAVCALHELISKDVESHKNLTPSFVSVLKQIIDRRLAKSYEYHKVPAPFVQIKLLKTLAILGAHDRETSREMYNVLEDTLARADTKNQIGNALVYETVRTIATIYPNPQLLAQCAQVISRFIKSTNNNLKYVGLNALACVVNVSPQYAAEHQMAVVDCLEDSDETLRKKTLDLLYKMTKPNNVEVIVERMLSFLKRDGDKYSDKYVREQTTSRVAELAERYAPDAKWYMATMTELFTVAGDVVKPAIGQSLMRLIAEGTGDAAADDLSRTSAVNAFVKLFDTPKLPLVLLETMVFVLSEFSELSGLSAKAIMDKLVDAASEQAEGAQIETLILSALAKIARRNGGGLSDKARDYVELNMKSKCVNKQQRASEVAVLIAEGEPTLSRAIQPSAMEVTVDVSLSSLNQYVSNALSSGSKPYQTKVQRDAALAAEAEAHAKAVESRVKANLNASRTTSPLAFEHRKPSSADASSAPQSRDPKDDLETFLSGGVLTPPSATPSTGRVQSPRQAEEKVDKMKVRLADAIFGDSVPSGPATAFTPPPRGAPTIRASVPPPSTTFDLLSELSVPTMTAPQPQSSSTSANPLAQMDLISLSSPPKQQASSPTSQGALRSLSGGDAKGAESKDPFADLFATK